MFSKVNGSGIPAPNLDHVQSSPPHKIPINNGGWVPLEFHISAKQFAHRLIPPYLRETKIVGIDSLSSAEHWINMLTLIVERKQPMIFSCDIPHQKLKKVIEILNGYASTLRRYSGTFSVALSDAKATLEEIERGLDARGVHYTPAGYRAGPNNQGHAIPMKLKRHREKEIESFFLNLGEGVQLHPKVDSSASVDQYHFQSFPTRITSENLASPRGLDALMHLILLQVENCPAEVQGYSAEDVYPLSYSLGFVLASFNSKIAERSSKPQLGDICGDMAIELIVKDVLIDQEVSHELIARLICLEKLCDIYFFYFYLMRHDDRPLDDWIGLKNGMKEFSLRGVNASPNVLSENEVEAIHNFLKPIFHKVNQHIATFEKKQLLALAPSAPSDYECNFKNYGGVTGISGGKIDQVQELKTFVPTPEIVSPHFHNCLETLELWAQTAEALTANGNQKKAHQFIYHATSLLPIPDPHIPGFWDQIPVAEITKAVDSLSRIMKAGIEPQESESESYLIYRNTLILHIGYAIVDKLVRRKYPQYFTGFSSPYSPKSFSSSYFSFFTEKLSFSNVDKQEDYFEFKWLPIGRSNRQWSQIRHYFETQSKGKPYTIFASGLADIFLNDGVRALRRKDNILSPWSSVQQHLKFLEQFLKVLNQPQMPLEDQFMLLWMNTDAKYVPIEIEQLYFFAHFAWGACYRHIPSIKETRVPREQKETNFILIKQPKLKFQSDQLLLGEKLSAKADTLLSSKQKLTENETQCLKSDSVSDLVLYRQWKRIFSNPQVQISSIALWMRSHHMQLSDRSLQEVVSIGLFQPGLLAAKLSLEPLILDQFREIIQNGISHFKGSKAQFETLLFFIRLGICIETFAPQPSLEALSLYESILLDSKKHAENLYSLYSHLTLLYQVGLPQGQDSLRELVKASFWLKYSEPGPNPPPKWLLFESQTPLEVHKAALVMACEDSVWMEKTASELIELIVPQAQMVAGCAGKYPLLKQGEYSIDLEKRKIYKGDLELVYINASQRKMLFQTSSDGLVWGTHREFFSQDGLSKIAWDESGTIQLARQFPAQLGMPPGWYVKSKVNPAILFDCALTQSKHFDHWGTTDIVVCKKNERRPLYVIKYDKETRTVYKVAADGSPKLMLINIWKDDNPFSDWFKRLLASKEACLWLNPETKKIEEIDLIETGLSFKAEGEKFRSVDHPEFFLAPEQMIEELGKFEGAIVLEKGIKKAVLLPARQMTHRQEDDFCATAVYSDFIEGAQEKVYFYHVDEVTGTLVQQSPEANLFLTILFAMQRDYNKALSYLGRSRFFQRLIERHFWAVQAILEMKDHSPEALAFYLRFALHLIHNQQQVLHSGYGYDKPDTLRGASDKMIDFIKWTADKYNKYLRVCSTKEISRIPSYAKLLATEEKYLLKVLRPVLMEEDNNALRDFNTKTQDVLPQLKEAIQAKAPQPLWRGAFDVREQLLTSGRWESKITSTYYALFGTEFIFLVDTQPSDALSYPPVLTLPKKELSPKVRFTFEDVREYFITLYEKAKKGEGEFDIFYLIRSNAHNNHIYSAYGFILRYVLKHPGPFAKYTFGADEAANRVVFKSIVEECDGFLAHYRHRMSLIDELGSSQLVLFRYQKAISCQLAPPPVLMPISWRFEEGDIKRFKTMIHEVYTDYLTRFLQTHFIPLLKADTPFAFKRFDQESAGYTTQSLIADLKKGHANAINPAYGRLGFALKGGKQIEECLKDVSMLHSTTKEKIEKIRQDAKTLANSYPDIAYRIGLRKIGSDLPEITMDGVLTQAYLKKDPMLIKKANPSLPEEHIYRLLCMTVEYWLLCIQEQQLRRAVVALQKNSIQDFGESLAAFGNYDPTIEPEIVLYQSRTGKSLRAEQAKLLQWEIETTTPTMLASCPIRLFAAPAGEGKTTLYLPIAQKRLERLGYVPFSTSSKALYRVDRDGLKYHAEKIFNFEMAVLELGLNTEATAADFRWFYEQMTQSPHSKSFKITPDLFYPLYLKYQIFQDQGDVEAIHWLQLIFRFLKTRAGNYIDECRLNCSPFTQAKMGIGLPISLPELDRTVFVQIYKALLRPDLKLKDGRSVKATMGLQENQQAAMEKKDLKPIRETILSALSADPFFAIPPQHRDSVINYWLDLSLEPSWFQSGASVDAIRAVELVKIYFDEFFPVAMDLLWRMHHVSSIKESEEVHVPARTRQATRSYFDDVYLTLIATIQGFLQEKLNEKQTKKLFQELEKVHLQQVGNSKQISDIEQSLRVWVRQENVRLIQYSISNPASMQQFHQLVHKTPEAIFWYLEHVVLKQIQYSPETITVTPFHFIQAFAYVTLFSADPGPEEIYGIYDSGKHVRKDPTFLAHAAHEFLTPENSQFIILPVLNNPRHFFDHLLEKDPAFFSYTTLICDVGGMLRNFTFNEFTADFFALLKEKPSLNLDGIVLFEESSDKEEETKLLLWLKDWPAPKEAHGHDIADALDSMGLNWEELHLLTFIDPSHRAGANIKQPRGSSLFVLLGEGQALTDGIQGKLRGRGVLKKEQRIISGVTQKLADTIATPISPQLALEWEFKNDVAVTEKEVLLSFYHQIDYWIEEPIHREIDQQSDPKVILSLRRRYRQGFVEKNVVDPISRFKGKKGTKSTDTLLWEYAEAKYQKFGFKTPWKDAADLQRKLKPIIASAKKRVSELPITPTVDSRRHTTIHTNQNETVKKQLVTTSHNDLEAEKSEVLSSRLSFSHSGWLLALCERSRPATEVFGSRFLTPHLFFTQNALKTAKSGGKSLGESFLKPVQYILFMEKQDVKMAFALSDEEAVFFQKELLTPPTDCKISLIAADGAYVGGIRLQSPAIHDIIIDVGLSQCTLHFPMRFIQRLEQWEDFVPMWEKMKKCQPQQPYSHEIEKLIPARLKAVVRPPSPPRSFFRTLKGLLGN